MGDQHEIRGLELELEPAQGHSMQSCQWKHLRHKPLVPQSSHRTEDGALTLGGIRYFIDPDQAVADFEHIIPKKPS